MVFQVPKTMVGYLQIPSSWSTSSSITALTTSTQGIINFSTITLGFFSGALLAMVFAYIVEKQQIKKNSKITEQIPQAIHIKC